MQFKSTVVSTCGLIAAAMHTANAQMVKMCLFYKPSGHARTDPILSDTCVSDHVHTFYGPQLFHPSTTNADLRNSDPRYSTSPWVENQSLYWHPTIYKVGQDTATGQPTYERAEISFSGPYYRWDKSAPAPAVEAFPPGFQMIAGMNPNLEGVELFSECLCPKPCTRSDGLCDSDSKFFPSSACGEMGISMNFPTCWDDSKGIGDTGDHMSHMAYTVDGTVEGACPPGYNRRLPQIQLFVRIANYEGGKHTFSDNTLASDTEVFHADFMNGWEEGALERIVNECQPVPGTQPGEFNPPCNCDEFLTKKSTLLSLNYESPGRDDASAAAVCPIDVKDHIVDEEIDFGVGGLPRGSCSAPVIQNVAPTFVDDCNLVFTENTFDEENCAVVPTARPTFRPTGRPTGSSPVTPRPTGSPVSSPTPIPTDAPVSSPVTARPTVRPSLRPTSRPTNRPTPFPTEPEEEVPPEEEDDEFWDECDDDEEFLFRGMDGKTCEWISRRERRINRLCQKNSVRTHCPLTCDECP